MTPSARARGAPHARRRPDRRPMPRQVPMDLVTEIWRPYIREPDGGISRRYYELCTLWQLRSLRAGNIWVMQSRRYANPDTYLIPPADWPRWRPEVIQQTGPLVTERRLAEREAELERAMADVERLLARKDSHLRVEKDAIGLSPLEADPRAASADALATVSRNACPRVELSDLLMEVDTWTYFSRRIHAADAEPSGRRSCPTSMAVCWPMPAISASSKWLISPISPPTTWPGVPWFLREDTLKAACTSLVNYHHQLPVSQAWGSGVLSSSDGQRFPVSGTTRHARRMPPSLGYGMGVTFYSWSSDQLSQYGTKLSRLRCVTPRMCSTRSVITKPSCRSVNIPRIRRGHRDHLCALRSPGLPLCAPAAGSQRPRLFASGPMNMQRYPRLQPHVAGRIHRPRILHWWDEMLRAAGSMKLGWVTASLLVQKLQAHPQQNALAAALQEYGRLARTLHIMHWYGHTEDRRRFLRQLNKGEALHDLRAALVIANKGQLRQRRKGL